MTQQKNEIILKVRGIDRPWVERLFCSVVEAINNLLAKWPQLKVEMRSPCSGCILWKREQPTLFVLRELETLFLQKQEKASCLQCNSQVDIKDVAPDMQMTYLKGRYEYCPLLL